MNALPPVTTDVLVPDRSRPPYRYPRAIATYVFAAAFLFAYVRNSESAGPLSLRPQYVELPVLAALFLVLTIRHRMGRGLGATWRVSWLALLLMVPGLWLYNGLDSNEGGFAAYVRSAFLYVVYIVLTASFAYMLYEEDSFLSAWWKLATAATLVALLGYGLAVVTGFQALVTFASYGGGQRLTGTLSEPSAWAAVLPGMILLAWHRRRPWYVALFAVAALLTKSPTVFLTLVLTLGILLLFRRGPLPIKILGIGGMALAIGYLASAISHPETALNLVASGNPIEIVLGRVLSGMSFLLSNGGQGTNDRAAGAQLVQSVVLTNDWLWTGRGLGASDIYFPYFVNDVRAWSLPVTIFFDLGLGGLILYVTFVVRALVRMRNAEVALVFLPFLIASAVNSAEGIQLYKLALLPVLLYGGVGVRTATQTSWSGIHRMLPVGVERDQGRYPHRYSSGTSPVDGA